MPFRDILNKENIYSAVSFLCSSAISISSYVQQYNYDIRLMIATNTIATIILTLSVFLIYTMKKERQKLKLEKMQIEDELEKVSSTGTVSRNQCEPLFETPRTDHDFLTGLMSFFEKNRINNIYYNRQKSNIEISMV